MRVSCFFVSVVIMLAEQIIALPMGDLPTLGSELKFAHSLATTLHPLPVVGGLTDRLLADSNNGALLSSNDLASDDGRGLLSILKRRGGNPVIDSSSDTGLMSNFDPIPLRNVISGLKPFTSGLSIPKMIKRDNNLGSLPLIDSLPGASSIPSLPGLGSLSSMPSLPGMGSLPSMPSLPGMSNLVSLPQMGSLPLVSSLPSLPSMPSVPGLSSVPGIGSLALAGSPA
ncbi:hypothetical protein PTTG_11639 [Puccinia triticina 1-1 BBBD Race 1]|uniref:Uncharacterized protein n=1 Tax=Puccinia triticina (isolate 1-1 / race 1 (BBBD)) TaxID=630390 RepID=A0A180H2Q7_PUCT1|nr:hypothetical protein PTTG_11639 [Puccinia triticina 1-1 BBBD Race 1]